MSFEATPNVAQFVYRFKRSCYESSAIRAETRGQRRKERSGEVYVVVSFGSDLLAQQHTITITLFTRVHITDASPPQQT